MVDSDSVLTAEILGPQVGSVANARACPPRHAVRPRNDVRSTTLFVSADTKWIIGSVGGATVIVIGLLAGLYGLLFTHVNNHPGPSQQAMAAPVDPDEATPSSPETRPSVLGLLLTDVHDSNLWESIDWQYTFTPAGIPPPHAGALYTKLTRGPRSNNLGFMYAEGRNVPQDDESAVEWFRRAADQNDANGQNNLGVMYAEGRGVQQNHQEAAGWFRYAADQGDANGQNNLVVVYAEGRGVPQDDENAVEWFQRAAEQGNAIAQRNLGVMYAAGRGVAQDNVSAHMWFNVAGAQNYDDARELRDALAERMTVGQIATAQNAAARAMVGDTSSSSVWLRAANVISGM